MYGRLINQPVSVPLSPELSPVSELFFETFWSTFLKIILSVTMLVRLRPFFFFKKIPSNLDQEVLICTFFP